MKRVLSFFLVLSMLLSLITLPTFASGAQGNDPDPASATALPTPKRVVPSIAANATTVEYDDGNGTKTYTVIRTVDEFYKITNGNYILANDLDFSTKGTITKAGYVKTTGNFILEGNGYSINNLTLGYTDGAGSGMFGEPASGTTTKVRNLTINAGGAIAANSTAVLFGTSSSAKPLNNVYIEGVTINAQNLVWTGNGTSTHGASVFYAKPRGNVYFKDCVVNGFTSMGASQNHGLAGFVGRVDQATTISFDNCHAIGTYQYSNAINAGEALFVGCITAGATVSFLNCTANARLISKGESSAAFVGYNGGATINFTECKLLGNGYTFENVCSAGFVGKHSAAGKTVSFIDCTVESDLQLTQSQNGGFVGCHEAPLSFTNCHLTGNLEITASKSGGFIGCTEDPGTASFNDCSADATVMAVAKGAAPFVGQSNTNGTLTFTKCNTEAFLVGSDGVSAYVGAIADETTPTVHFTTCTNGATVYSLGSAGVWLAEIGDGVTVNVDGECKNNATICSVTLLDGAKAVAGSVTAEALSDGSYAYEIAQAQKLKNVADEYLVGQHIGTDPAPAFGGKTVYKVTPRKSDAFYSNQYTGVQPVPAEDNGNAKAYIQTTAPFDGKVNNRIIIAAREENLNKIADLQVEITYTLKDGSTKTLIRNESQLDCFYSVYAGNVVAEAEEGFVLLALVVQNIPTDEWDGVAIAIRMNANDAQGASLPDMQLDAALAPLPGPYPKPIAVLKETTLYLFEGDSQKLGFSIDANGAVDPLASDVAWMASTDCVKVENGVVTALKQGYAYVSGGGDTQCLIRVVPKEMPEIIIDAGGVDIVRDNADPDYYYACSISLIADSNPTFNLSDLVAGIRVRGNSTARADKKPYRIKFEKKQNLLGMHEGEKFKSWVLLSEPYDDSMIRNTTALTLAAPIIDNYSADWRYVKLTLNGEYRGVYVLTEQSQVNKNRINIEEAGEDSQNVLSGYLFEMDASPTILPDGTADYLVDKIILSYEDWVINEFHGGKVFNRSTNDIGTRELHIALKNDGLTPEQEAFAVKYIQNIFKILYYATQEGIYYEFDANYDLVEVANSDSETTLRKVLDIDSLARMYIHSELVMNGDQSKKSFYMWADFSEKGDGKLHFGCPWDFDSAFCGYKSYTFQDAKKIFAAKRNLWYVMPASCEWFREEVCRVWDEVYEETNGFANASYVLDNIVKYYKDEIDVDAARWARTHDHEEYAVKTRDWVEQRVEWLNEQFDLENQESVFLNP